MGRITSSVGLFSGVPIAETVEKLVALQTGPRDQLTASIKTSQQRQTAVTDLTARLIALQFTSDQLGIASTFDTLNATSSDTSALTASASSSAATGNYQFTAIRQAQAQQALSSAFASRTSTVGAGTFSFRAGGAINPETPLAQLNGGQGVARGSIRITDRGGATADIDLRFARTVNDVLNAINGNTSTEVRAEIVGDSIRLVDDSGKTTANLRVQEVGIGGKTAASLGLDAINVAADSATGSDIVRLGNALSLGNLNDGLGLRINSALADLRVSLRDGSTLEIDLHRAAIDSGFAKATTTAANGPDARLTFSALKTGADYDGVKVEFVDDPNVTVGNESISFDKSNPAAKKIVVRIDAGNTTAGDVVAAANASSEFNDLFTTAPADGDGTGLVDVGDTATTSGGAAAAAVDEQTLGDLLATINAIDPDRLRAEIAPDGDRLQLVDVSEDLGHEFAVEGLFNSQLARDLGLDGEAEDGKIIGRRILAGPNTVLLKNLNGGRGVGELGVLTLTDRSGATASVDLSEAETLADVIDAINAADVGIDADINSSRNGVVLSDTSGGAGNLVVASGDGTQTAEKLNLAADTNTSRIETGHLHRQVVNEATTLDSLNAGGGIARGRIRLYDTAGLTNSLDLSLPQFKTIGDVIDGINALAVGIHAQISDDGDGFLLIDEAGAEGQIRVEDQTGHAARDLGLLGSGKTTEIDGQSRWAINGSSTTHIEIDADDTLDDLVTKINERNAGVTATVLFDGAVARLSLVTQHTGEAAALVYDTTATNFTVEETAKGQDALVLFGSASNPAASVLAASSTNTFSKLVAGLTLNVKNANGQSVSVTVAANDSSVSTRVKSFVDAYNALRDKLNTYTSFDTKTFAKGVLFGSVETLRIQDDLGRLVSSRIFGAGELNSLARVGVSFKQDGTMEYDEAKLNEALASNRQAVREFFTKEETGVSDRLHKVIESLAGVDNSLLVSRAQALQTRVESDSKRVDFLNDRLDAVRTKLLIQFQRMESAIAKIQTIQTSLASIQPLTIN